MNDIYDRARSVLLRNERTGHDRRTGKAFGYISPSPHKYPFQWSWDSCLHAVALSHIEPELAKREIRTLLLAQHPDGFVPHVTFWRLPHPFDYIQCRRAFLPRHTALVQPPVLAQAVAAVYRRSGDTDFLDEVLPGVQRHYLWLLRRRDPDSDGLISIISPYEGLDYSPAYDAALGLERAGYLRVWCRTRCVDVRNWLLNYRYEAILRRGYFNVEDVLVNCVFAQGLRLLAALCEERGRQEEAETLRERAGETERALLRKCYDEADGCFYNLYSTAELPAKVKTVGSLFPLILEGLEGRVVEALVGHLLSPDEFWAPFPVPSVSMNEPSFNPHARLSLWRGPTWINTNWFLVGGLRRHGYPEVARDIVKASLELVNRSGFREYYDPITGEGLGASNFGWSTLVLDMMEE